MKVPLIIEIKKFMNELINEHSPYLLQHAHNPVNWHPWGEKALNLAKQENKMLLISIGYAACHWCHVMEHESFEDKAVASVMNENFICIKVDREEHPEVDQIYMNACQLINGSGGWPLNAIALPDGKPVYAVTYLPKENWVRFLEYFADFYKNDYDKLAEQAENITGRISDIDLPDFSNIDKNFSKSKSTSIFQKIDSLIDYEKGGMKGRLKFPMPGVYKYLLTDYYHTKNRKSLEAVTVTINNMFQGGIYDHIGGGFARYSTDSQWIVPHFEKMLYDNAQLISLYCDAYKVTQDETYKNVVYQCIDFVKRELTDSNGGFYSSIDADSEGKEGVFYTWSYDELQNILGENEFKLFSRVYDITKSGNFEGKNILTLSDSVDKLTNKIGIPADEIWNKINEWNKILLSEREKRVAPRLDNKIIASWNALMLKGLTDAYNTFGDESFLNLAIKNADYIINNLIQKDFALLRIKKSGINGFLDDYASVIEAFISLYQTTFDESYVIQALSLSEYVLKHFDDDNTKMFFYTSGFENMLIARKIDSEDNVIPSSNSVMANNLSLLGLYFDKREYIERAKQMLSVISQQLESNPWYFYNWGFVNNVFTFPPKEVAIAGENAKKMKSELLRNYLPNIIISGCADAHSKINLLPKLNLGKRILINNETMIYVCQNGTCKLPVSTVADALEQLRE